MKKTKENRTAVEMVWFYLHRIICALILLYLITPVLVIVPLSFSESAFLVYPVQGFSLRWYENFFSSPTWMLGLKNTLIVAPLATIIAMVLGTLAALGFNRANFFGKAFLMSLLVSPMVVPVVIVGVAAYLFFAPLGMANNIWLLILMHAVLGVPFVVITVLATLEGFDQNLVKAASSLGASPVYAFFRVTLPIIAPGVISGGLFAFGISFDEVVLTLFVAGPISLPCPG